MKEGQNLMGSAAGKLKELIDKNGPTYLTDEPYEVYKELVDTKTADRKTASAVLMLLVNGIIDNVKPGVSFEFLSKYIQQKCGFNKKMADMLAEISLSLHSIENEKDWESKKMEGLARFKKEKLSYQWKGYAVWEVSNGSVTCRYNADIVAKPTEKLNVEKKLEQKLKKNPFMTPEAIGEYYKKKLKEYLDREFEEYVTCDDYYEPLAEDFEAEDYVDIWCRDNGFELEAFEGDGENEDYEPYLRHW